MNSIDFMFYNTEKILSIYFTAGFPSLDSTTEIIKQLKNCGVNMIEIGLPYSDPLADGPTIQNSNKKALENGMTYYLLISQLKDIKKYINIPLVIMGYYNQFLQIGAEFFLKKCKETGISGIILPDLSADIYKVKYKHLFDKYNIYFILLATPKTSDERIIYLSKLSQGFLYIVSSTATTGSKFSFEEKEVNFLKRVQKLKLSIPTLIGFGIYNKQTLNLVCQHARGGIIGSAFINILKKESLTKRIKNFIQCLTYPN